MSRITNVWTCADEGQVNELKKALRLVPHAACVLGWSYARGQRRGICYDVSTEAFCATDSKSASPASILHFACLNGNMEMALIAFAKGARSGTRLDAPVEKEQPWANATCLDVARENHKAGLVSSEFLNLMELSAIRECEALIQLQEQEAFRRSCLLTEFDRCVTILEQFANEGLVEVSVEIRGVPPPAASVSPEDAPSSVARSVTGLSGDMTLKFTVRRSIRKKELQDLVSSKVGQSVGLSIFVPEIEDDTASMLSSPIESDPSGRRAGDTMSAPLSVSRSSAAATPTSTQRRQPRSWRAVELSNRNIRSFLMGTGALRCVARPLINPMTASSFITGDSSLMVSIDDNAALLRQRPASRAAGDEPEGESHERPPLPPGVSFDEVRRALTSFRAASPLPHLSRSVTPSQRATRSNPDTTRAMTALGSSRIDQLKDVVRRFDERVYSITNLQANASLLNKTLSSDSEASMLSRLYDQEMKTVKERRAEYQNYVDEGAQRLTRRKKTGALSAELEESVSRLCYEGVAKRQEKIAEIESAVMAMVPRAKESTLASEDAEAARERLMTTTRHDEELSALRQRFLGEGRPVKRLTKSREAAVVQSVFFKAIEKKSTSLTKLEGEYGDFRARKQPSKKITRDEEKAIGDRLSKKS